MDRARTARLSGDCAKAKQILSAELFAYPDDPDLWLEKSYCETASGKYTDARQSLEQAQRLAPDYLDVLLALARLDFYEGNYQSAEARLGQLEDTPETADLKSRISRARAEQHKTMLRADLSVGKSFLSKGLADWDYALATLSVRTSPKATFYASTEYNKRFGVEDIYYEAGLSRSLGKRLSGYVSAGGTPDSDYRPKLKVSAGLEGWLVPPRETSGGAYATLSTSVADYELGSVSTIMPALYYATPGDAARIGVKYVHVIDENGKTRTGEIIDALFNASPSARFGMTAGRAPENSDGQTLTVTSLSAWAGWRFANTSELRCAVIREERTAYDLTGVTLSLSKTF